MGFLGETPIVIAEIGNNHGGSLELAKRMVVAAVRAGTPYVKFQTMIPERLLSRDHPAFEEFSREALSFDDFRALERYCREHGAVFLSTPFDLESADFLEELGVPAFKVASGDLTYLPFLTHVARNHKPILLSTGASTLDDIDAAVQTIRSVSEAELILMHCTAAYPCPDEEANLGCIPTLASRYGCRVGLSDHTLGIEISLAAVGLGARVVEKHFTINRELPGGDNSMSVLPQELERLNVAVQRVHRALGSSLRLKTPSEMRLDVRLHRSLIVRRDVKPGEIIRPEDLDAVRPGGGISPNDLDKIVGRRVAKRLRKGDKVRPESLGETAVESILSGETPDGPHASDAPVRR